MFVSYAWYTIELQLIVSQIGAAKYRELRATGRTAFPAPKNLETATEFSVKSPARGHLIPCRVLDNRNGASRGIFLHFHGGGFTLGSAAGQDLLLDYIANEAQLTVVSVDYRLAPEHPFPAPIEDCKDVADWIVKNGKEKWGTDLKFLGGESAGGTLAASLMLHLRDTKQDSTIVGLALNYGCYDLSVLPAARDTHEEKPILRAEDTYRFLSTYLPDLSIEERKSGAISPAYNDLRGLGSALFLIGTADALIEDTVLMSFRWRQAGNEAIVKFLPGACHGFMVFDGHSIPVVKEGWDILIQYLRSKL